MKTSICIIRSNPVRPDSRVEKEAWSLVRAGYNVHVLAWDRDSDHPEEQGFLTVADEHIPITWLGYKAAYSAGMKSLKPFLRFQIHMRKWLKKHKNDFDIIHACDFDTALFSRRITKKQKFVFDIFDFLYAEPKTFLQRIIRKSQIRIINQADATIICTEQRKEQIEGSHPKKLVVIHNTPFEQQLSGAEEFCLQNDSPRPKIAYVGILAEERMLSAVGHCMERLPDVELHIAGFGQLEEYFIKLSQERDNVFFYGRIPYNQALQLETKCDIMTAIYDPSNENCRRAAPNKFYESLMLGKPVVMAGGTGMSDLVREHNIGTLIEFSEEGFEHGIRELIRHKEEWPDMSVRMKRLYHDNYSWDVMNKRLIELYSQLSV